MNPPEYTTLREYLLAHEQVDGLVPPGNIAVLTDTSIAVLNRLYSGDFSDRREYICLEAKARAKLRILRVDALLLALGEERANANSMPPCGPLS